MFSMWIHFCLYDLGQMAVIVIVLCVLIFYLLKWTRNSQFYQMMRNVNSKTSPHRYKSTPETTNLARVARLILGPCTDLLRDILKGKTSPSNLSKTVKILIDDIKKNKLKNPFNKQQIALIFPKPTKNYAGDYSDFDISLLYILLRNLCKITPHNKGWGEKPDPTDNSVSANIERIRLTRNKYYGHAADFSLSDSDFKQEWQNIHDITVELEQHFGTSTVYQDAVKDIRTCSMDPEIEAKYIDKLLLIDELCETVKSHTDEIKKLQQDILPNVKDEIKKLQYVIPRNVKGLHEVQLMQLRVDDDVYSETHTFQEMLNKVRGQPYMTFVGVPGSGKSATIHHIALIFQEEGYEIIPIIDIRKIEDYIDSNNQQVFVIDDVVGVLGLQKQKLETLVDYEKIISDPSTRTKVLMSCREAVFNECYQSFFLNEENIIKMCSPENALNDDDKKAILQKHGLDKDLLSPTLLREASPMFPFLCKLYSKEEKFRNSVERFFTCPARYILEELDKMQKQNRLQYATLVLCLLNENKLSNKILKDTGNNTFCEMKSNVLEICKVKSYTDAFEFVDTLSAMEGTYTELCGTEYTFIHDSMFEIIAHHFGSQFPNLMLTYMSSSYIANSVKLTKNEMLKLDNEFKQASEKVEINSESKNEKIIACEGSQNGEKVSLSAENGDRKESLDLCIRLGEDQYSMLAERLYKDIENMELYDVFMNDILKHPQVCEAFIGVLETKSYTELKSLFLSVQEDVSKVVSKGKRVMKENEKRDKWSMEWYRQGVLVNEKDDCKEETYSVRVISWVVYYGHNQILKYILEQTDSNKETQSEFFLNSFNLDLLYPAKQGKKNIAANNLIENAWTFTHLDIDGSISEHQRLLLLSCYNGVLETVRICIKYMKRNTICIIFPELNFKYVLGDEALEAACKGGHLSVVKELVEAGADVNSQGVFNTPLITAFKSGHMSVVKELIEAGADINQKGEYDTPLTAACRSGHLSVVKELVEKGVDVNSEVVDYEPLRIASKGGYISIVKELIRAGANINQNDWYDCGPLTAACKDGHLSVVKELIEAGADINEDCYNDYTPLTTACKGGYIGIVKELLGAGADVNLKGEHGKFQYNETPLRAACKGGHLDIVRELVKAGADVNQRDEYAPPLTTACTAGHLNIVRELVEAGADVNRQGAYNTRTPLTAACKGGHLYIVKWLVEAGADVNRPDAYDTSTPLTAACKAGHLNIVRELVEAGADVNQRDKYAPPLTTACKAGHLYIVRELVEAGADINQRDEYASPLTTACKAGLLNIVRELVEAGADVNQWDEYAKLLIAACEGGHINLVKELLEAGADVNLQGKYDTPLTAACYSGHISLVKELLEASADVNLHGQIRTPLTAAIKGGNMNIVKELISAGADVNLQDKFGTPLTAACEGGHDSFVKELIDAGADVNLKTPLILACYGGHGSIVMELLKAGADVNLQVFSCTSLIAACWGGHEDVLKELVKAGACVNLHGYYYAPLRVGVEVFRESFEYYTPLTLVCRGGYMDGVKTLLKAGSDINPQDEYLTPLIAAIEGGYISIIKELLSAGADVNLQGKHKTPVTAAYDSEHRDIEMELNAPLTAACEYGHVGVVKELLQKGADINLQGEHNTVLTLACTSGHTSMVVELLRAGADVNLRRKYDYNTPLTLACKKGHLSIVIELLRAGADVNLQGENDTPLITACRKGYIVIAKKLLDAKSDVNMQDRYGNTPLYIAFANINKTFIPVILQMFYIYAADLTISNKEGISTVYIALLKNEITVKQLLRTENEHQLDNLKLHIFECLVNIRHSDVMTDSKDDVVVTRRRVWRIKIFGDLYESIIKINCKGLKHLLCIGLDVNQLIQFYDDDSNIESDVYPLWFILICHYFYDESLLDKVQILLKAGMNANARVRHSEIDSVLDREGVSVLEEIRREVSELSKNENDKVIKYKKAINEVKKHLRRYSV